MNVSAPAKNWIVGETPSIVARIHEDEVNIAIFNRGISTLEEELNSLLQKDVEFRSSGTIKTISKAITNTEDLIDYPLIKQDMNDLLDLFSEVAKAKSYRLYFATVSSNMCKKFHTDINDLRMLCTYKGPGTLWLTEDNADRDAMDCCDDNDCMVIDESRIQQANTGAVVMLKGAIYPKEGTKAILHRSPTIEESGERRLLLRIDTDEFLNF